MDHSFIPSFTDSSKCAKCKFNEIAHSESAECETCNNIGPVDLVYGNMLMCKSCQVNEAKLQTDNMNVDEVSKRLRHINPIIEASRNIDSSIQVRTDLFNAATVSIVELKSTIDNDESITNKPYALATELTQRFTHFKNVVFEANETIIAASNQQKAIQIYLNNLSNQLRSEEREKLKIADINYKPSVAKIVKPKSIKTASKKLDKIELRKYATELGVSEFTLQMLVISKGITVEVAANLLRNSINETKSIK
jgi:hypothetical protein